jgi:hemolysin activation/secretion protein
MDPAGDATIPFQRLLTNDDPDLFRGYEDDRFHDRGLALVTAEYRWPVWAPVDGSGPGVDAYLLADFGQVFGTFDELSFDNLTRSWGGGFRLVSRHGFSARVEIARGGDEEFQLRLKADQVFQVFRSTLLGGKNPVPER